MDFLRFSDLMPQEFEKLQEEAFERDIKRITARKDEFVPVNCPACRSSKAEFAFEKHHCTFNECKDCRTIYMSPRPNPELMNYYYTTSENYQVWSKHIFPMTESFRKEKIHKPRYEKIFSLCKQYLETFETLVEVGPGFGTFCEVANEAGDFQNVIAIETSPSLAESCRKKNITVIEKRIEDSSDSDFNNVDIIVSFEVLEHLFDPYGFIKGIIPRLKSKGLLVLTCPSGLGFDVVMLQQHSQTVDIEHVNLFNPRSIDLLLKSLEMEVIDISTPGSLDVEIVEREINQLQDQDSFVRELLTNQTQQVKNNFQRFLSSNLLSSHMWVVAQKN